MNTLFPCPIEWDRGCFFGRCLRCPFWKSAGWQGQCPTAGTVLPLPLPLPVDGRRCLPPADQLWGQVGKSGDTGSDGWRLWPGYKASGQTSGGGNAGIYGGSKARKRIRDLCGRLSGGTVFLHIPAEEGISDQKGWPDRYTFGVRNMDAVQNCVHNMFKYSAQAPQGSGQNRKCQNKQALR